MKIKIADIKIADRNRKARKAQEIADSIQQIGFLSPITLSKDLTLIAGLNRLEAHKLLGRDEIECNVIDLTGAAAKIAEIDENLIRDDLTAWEQGVWLAKRKEYYLELYPETANGMRNGQTSKKPESGFLETASFVDSTANLTGKSKSAIKDSIQIATNLKPFADEIAELPLANKKTQLLELAQIAKKEPEQARAIIQEIKQNPEIKVSDVEDYETRQRRKKELDAEIKKTAHIMGDIESRRKEVRESDSYKAYLEWSDLRFRAGHLLEVMQEKQDTVIECPDDCRDFYSFIEQIIKLYGEKYESRK